MFLGFFLFIFLEVRAQSITDLVRQTLTHNFDINLLKLQTEERIVTQERNLGKYDFNITALAMLDRDKNPVASTLDGGSGAKSVVNEVTKYGLTLDKKLSTGTDLSLPYESKKVFNTSSYRLTQTTYEPSMTVKITHPLIKGFIPNYIGKDFEDAVAETKILELEKDEKIIQHLDKFIEKLFSWSIDIVTSEKNKENLKALAEKYKFAEAKKSVNRINEIDYLEAKGMYKKAEFEEEQLEVRIEKNRNELEFLIYGDDKTQLSREVCKKLLELLPPIPSISTDEILDNALKNRVEKQRHTNRFDLLERAVSNAKVDRWPTFDYKGDLVTKGLSDNMGDAQKQLKEGKYTSWMSSVNIEYAPFGKVASSQLTIKQLQLKQEELKSQQTELLIRRDAQTILKELKAAQLSVEANELLVKVEVRRLEMVSRQVSLEVKPLHEYYLELERYTNALTQLLKSKSQYLKTYYSLYKIQGHYLKGLGL